MRDDDQEEFFGVEAQAGRGEFGWPHAVALLILVAGLVAVCWICAPRV